MRTTLAALLVLATAGTAGADAHNEVMIGSYTRALRASSANAVTNDSLGGGVLGYAREIDLGLMPKLQTWATAGFAWGGADGTMFSTLTTELTTQTFSFGGRAQYNVFRHLAVGGRLDLGPSRAGLTLTEGARTLHDSAWGVATTAAATLDARLLAYPAFKLGLRAELGYTMASKLDLAPGEANDSSMIQLEMSQASLGHLDVSGKYFSVTVLSQF
jgi:hypothetical protein